MFLKTKNNLYKMKHLRRFNESEENVYNSIFGKNKFKINPESRIDDFKK